MPKAHGEEAESTVGLGGYMQGLWAELAEDNRVARKGYLAALADDPDNNRLRALAMESALASGDIDTAERLAKATAQPLKPGFPALLKVVSAVRDNTIKEARGALRVLRQPQNQLPLVDVLDAYFAAHENTPLDKVLPLLATQPGWPSVWHRARLLVAANRNAEALALIERKQDETQGVFLLADLQRRLTPKVAEQEKIRARFKETNTTLTPLLDASQDKVFQPPVGFKATLADDTAAALLEFAMQLLAQNQPKLALQVVQLAGSLSLSEPLLQKLIPYYTALLHQVSGDIPAAKADLQVLTQQPTALGSLAKLQLAELQFIEADARQRKVIANQVRQLAEKNSGYEVFWASAAQLALASKQDAKAAEAATHLLALLPHNPSSTLPERKAKLYFSRGAAYAQAGQGTKAEADLKEALALNPAHADALNYLAYLWVEENRNLPEAIKMLKRAHMLMPANGSITDSLGWALYKAGDYEAAKGYLELAMQQEPGMPEIVSHLADTYAKLGNKTEAQKLWKRAYTMVLEGAEVPNKDFVKTLKEKAGQ